MVRNVSTPKPRIELFTVQDLPELASRSLAISSSGDFIPINIQRAESLVKNPQAFPDDPAMLVAWEGNTCLGYFGMIPVDLCFGDESERIMWLTTWASNPKSKSSWAGMLLLQEAMKLGWDMLIIASKQARRVCAGFGFDEYAQLPVTKIQVNAFWQILPKNILLRGLARLGFQKEKIATLLKNAAHYPVSKGMKNLIYSWLIKQSPSSPIGWKWEKNDHFPMDFKPSRVNRQAGLSHSGKIINWVLNDPWVLPEGKSLTEGRDYFFSDTRPVFKNELYVLKNIAGQIVGTAVFQISQINIRMVLRCIVADFSEELAAPYLLRKVLESARSNQVDLIEIESMYVPANFPQLFTNQTNRLYQAFYADKDSSPLLKAKAAFRPTLGDGDKAFT
ncbi:MAG: hypothetical protein JXA19_05145 [Anaerolineales bacterium]|nr:hypothetical protein [Anaerolineales bacterium]